jgi:uroporphyrinogen-III synthase
VRVINTRPQPDAASLTEALVALGHEVIEAPLLDIMFEDRSGPLDLDGVQAVLATSANGVRALAAATACRDISLFTVGDASARTAEELGFGHVTSAHGDVDDLAGGVIRALDPVDGALLHVAGSKVAGDLAGTLAGANFVTRCVTLYESRAAASLPPAASEALDSGNVDAVVFFSPRTAKIFVRLVDEAGVAHACQLLNAYCLSPAVAEEVTGLAWRAVHVAERPAQNSLLDCLSETALS